MYTQTRGSRANSVQPGSKRNSTELEKVHDELQLAGQDNNIARNETIAAVEDVYSKLEDA